jgi:hypothetical protein
MSDQGSTSESVRPRVTPARIAVQVIGFLIGIALLAWCVRAAFFAGEHSAQHRAEMWARLREAEPMLLIGLLAFTLASLVINGTTFWLTARPIARIGFAELQWLNLACNLLNYAPVRLGALARVLYHLRVNRMTLLQVGAWFMMIACIMVLGVGACFAALLLRPRIDLLWFAMVLGLMITGALLLRATMSHSLASRYGPSLSAAIRDPLSLGGACVLRLIDLACYCGRMTIAMTILGISVSAPEAVVLALVAFTVSLVPFGRLGFREAAVALVASRMHSAGGDASILQLLGGDAAATAQLALLESAGEALVVLPLGAFAMLRLRRRWRRPTATM